MKLILSIAFLFASLSALAVDPSNYVVNHKVKGAFPLVTNGTAAQILISNDDFPGATRAAHDLQRDIERVTGILPVFSDKANRKIIVIVGTVGKSAIIDGLIGNKKIDGTLLKGKREKFIIQIVDKPMSGVDRALVIAGSDKRGTIYGIYDLSSEIGVSPWYWWADVPVKKQQELYVVPGIHTMGEPAVEYRGIFINDEQPALGGWVKENTGGFNHQFYEKVFELILRMKGNFLWPAMWGQSFFSDDTLSHKLADQYGIVISTSHHEPLMRAHVEWQRQGGGAWNYNTNAENLRKFWREGIVRMKNYESIVTLAMRGDGDEPMSEESNVKLLERIVADQRQIISEVTSKDVTTVPQVWALYKEVQDYYDKGMRVPDDVTLLLCDDNWGNIRKLPSLVNQQHKGGYGIYYHFDYVGDPRNYKWINTNPIAKVWEQMHLAYEYNARKIWIVNVGDIKPMEFPIEFFLDYAWDPEQWPQDKLQEYTQLWAKREFGEAYMKDIAGIMSLYTKYNGRRKPELLAPDSYSPQLYSLVNYNEARKVVNEYNALAKQAEVIYHKLPPEVRDSYDQLILYPVKASANINEMFYHVRLNHLYAAQQRIQANAEADSARQLFIQDSLLSYHYNKEIAGGKWNHMMDQLHVGYKWWHDDFNINALPPLINVSPRKGTEAAITVEGSLNAFPSGTALPSLPPFDQTGNQTRSVTIFSKGTVPFSFKINCSQGYVKVTPAEGEVITEKLITISIDWSQAPLGTNRVPVAVQVKGQSPIVFYVDTFKHDKPISELKGFTESDGYVAIDPERFSRNVGKNEGQWVVLPDHGRTGSAITFLPAHLNTGADLADSPFVEYETYFFHSVKGKIKFYLSPTIDFTAGDGLKFGFGIDSEKPQVLNMHTHNNHRDWQESVKNNIRVVEADVEIQPGAHTIKFYRIDPGVVLQKIVIDAGGLRESYLGPPASPFMK